MITWANEVRQLYYYQYDGCTTTKERKLVIISNLGLISPLQSPCQDDSNGGLIIKIGYLSILIN